MWISTNDNGSSSQAATHRSDIQMPRFSDEDNHSAPQPTTGSRTIPPQSTPSQKKAIKTYAAPARRTASPGGERTSVPPTKPLRPAKRLRLGFCALLYAAGTFASGFLFAALPQQEREMLHYFSQQQLSIGSAQPFERFLTLFLPAVVQIGLVLVFSFCAVGIPLIGVLITLSGIASGATALVWISEYGASGLLVYILSFGLYQALLTAMLCSLGQSGVGISSRLFTATFSRSSPHRSTEQESRINERFLRSNLSAVIGLVAICGVLAATSNLCQRLISPML